MIIVIKKAFYKATYKTLHTPKGLKGYKHKAEQKGLISPFKRSFKPSLFDNRYQKALKR